AAPFAATISEPGARVGERRVPPWRNTTRAYTPHVRIRCRCGIGDSSAQDRQLHHGIGVRDEAVHDAGVDVDGGARHERHGLVGGAERDVPGDGLHEDRSAGLVVVHRLPGNEGQPHHGGAGDRRELLDARPAPLTRVELRETLDTGEPALDLLCTHHASFFVATISIATRCFLYFVNVDRIWSTRLRASESRRTLRTNFRVPGRPSSARMRLGSSSAMGAKPTFSTSNPFSSNRLRHSSAVSGRALTLIERASDLRISVLTSSSTSSGSIASSWMAYRPPARSTRRASCTISALCLSVCMVSIASPTTTSATSSSSPVFDASPLTTLPPPAMAVRVSSAAVSSDSTPV